MPEIKLFCKTVDPLPDPQPTAVEGFSPRLLMPSGGWGIRPQTTETACRIADFWQRVCIEEMHLLTILKNLIQINDIKNNDYFKIWFLNKRNVSKNFRRLLQTKMLW